MLGLAADASSGPTASLANRENVLRGGPFSTAVRELISYYINMVSSSCARHWRLPSQALARDDRCSAGRILH